MSHRAHIHSILFEYTNSIFKNFIYSSHSENKQKKSHLKSLQSSYCHVYFLKNKLVIAIIAAYAGIHEVILKVDTHKRFHQFIYSVSACTQHVLLQILEPMISCSLHMKHLHKTYHQSYSDAQRKA